MTHNHSTISIHNHSTLLGLGLENDGKQMISNCLQGANVLIAPSKFEEAIRTSSGFVMHYALQNQKSVGAAWTWTGAQSVWLKWKKMDNVLLHIQAMQLVALTLGFSLLRL